MINIIGFKRVIFIAALIAVNAVLGFALYNYLMPQTEKLEREVRTVNSKIATATSDIERMQIEFDQLGQQQNFFNALKEDRFFSTQSRRYAEEVFVQAEQDSGVISATVKVSGGKKLPNEEAEKAEEKLWTI